MRNLIKITEHQAKTEFANKWIIKVVGSNRFNLANGYYINEKYNIPMQPEKGINCVLVGMSGNFNSK